MTKQDYEKEIDQIVEMYGCIDNYTETENYKNRWIMLTTDIEQDCADYIVGRILRYNKEDADRNIPVKERVPIKIFISSSGGDLDAGFELVDIITNSITPVYTINLGCQFSMGCVVGLAGHKRFANKNAKYLLHDGSFAAFELDASKMKDYMYFNGRNERKVKQFILSKSNISAKEYDSKIRVEWYMFADEAKRRNMVDYIIGEDCDINLRIYNDKNKCCKK